ncbi:BnaCnng39990D [Brassica napus]|uniref:Methionine aminopeptidase n=1 Tax=Brassica napus TaxID=3708 RepID=A0A078J9S2_BRANA|nr:BnaCnng39990D [Brassica napus]
MATAKSLQPRMFSSFHGNNSIRSTQPLLHLFRIDVGRRHVSMQLSRTFSGLTNLLFNRRNEDEVIDGNRKRLKPGNSLESQVDSRFTTRKLEFVNTLALWLSQVVCTSVNECICHGIPDSRPLEDGDTINIDVTVYLNGYHGDTSATFFCGDVDEKAKNLVQYVTKESLDKAISICGPGVEYKKVGKTIHDHADKHKYGVVRQFVGHGIGRVFHADPVVLYFRNNEAGRMVLNQTFTIEPMLTIGSIKPVMWDDNWTVVTEDASLSA